MSDRHVVIMAGGAGTRFWPESRHRFPKQFLKIGGEKALLRETADRVLAAHSVDQLWVVTGAHHAEHARAALPELPAKNLLIEPAARNTAPCIAWAVESILIDHPGARIAVLPADHHIGEPAAFLAFLEAAFEAASEHIVMFGIVPDRPETGYGYIQRGAKAAGTDRHPVHEVVRFVEKPDTVTAQRYLEAGDYLWNSGMFVFPAALMRSEIEAFIPELSAGIRSCVESGDVESIYPSLPSVSIDYGVMERSARTRVIPSRFAWSDVGSWDAAADIHPPDDDGNVVIGDAALVDTRTSMVKAESGRMVAVVGLDDVIVVDTPDAVLVVRRGQSQSVKKIVETLRSKGRQDLL